MATLDTLLEIALGRKPLWDTMHVRRLLEDAHEAIEALADRGSIERPGINAELLRVADTLLGGNPDYLARKGWNEPGRIDQWAALHSRNLYDCPRAKLADYVGCVVLEAMRLTRDPSLSPVEASSEISLLFDTAATVLVAPPQTY